MSYVRANATAYVCLAVIYLLFLPFMAFLALQEIYDRVRHGF